MSKHKLYSTLIVASSLKLIASYSIRPYFLAHQIFTYFFSGQKMVQQLQLVHLRVWSSMPFPISGVDAYILTHTEAN